MKLGEQKACAGCGATFLGPCWEEAVRCPLCGGTLRLGPKDPWWTAEREAVLEPAGKRVSSSKEEEKMIRRIIEKIQKFLAGVGEVRYYPTGDPDLDYYLLFLDHHKEEEEEVK